MSPSSPSIRRPSCALLALEPVRAALEFAGHQVMREATLPRGDGHAVVVFPGLATNGTIVRPLRSFCKRLGYSCFDWGQGFNTGPRGEIDGWLDALAEGVQERTAGHAAPISLVGWSLGGIYAREVAKRLRSRVRQVITIGTPFAGAAQHTNAGLVYRLLNGGLPPDDSALLDRLRMAPPVPSTSIYSRSDGVVAWQACMDARRSRRSEAIEIEGSHCGMPWNPAVLRVVADRLGQPLRAWRPYAHGGRDTQGLRAAVSC